MGKRRVKTKRSSSTFGFSPPASTDVVAINVTLTASEAYYWIPLRGTGDAVFRPANVMVRAAASAPSNLRFIAEISDDGSTWRTVWSSATGLIGTNSQLIKLKIPKMIGRALYARIGAVSSGAPTLAGYASFVVYDPL